MDIKNRPEPSCPESIAIDMSQMLGLIFGIGDYSPYELALVSGFDRNYRLLDGVSDYNVPVDEGLQMFSMMHWDPTT